MINTRGSLIDILLKCILLEKTLYIWTVLETNILTYLKQK